MERRFAAMCMPAESKRDLAVKHSFPCARYRASFLCLTFIIICCALLCGREPANAAPISHGTLDLIAEDSSIAPGHAITLGLHFKLEHGWHIYWVNPGDSGEPPIVTWQLPEGITAGVIEWPTPQKLGTSTIVDYGYEGDVLLLVPARAAANVATAKPAQLGAAVRFLICREMCIPGKAQLSLTLPVRAQAASPDGAVEPMFAAARAHLPKPSPATWKYSARETKSDFVLDLNAGHAIAKAIFFPREESQVNNSAPQQLVSSPTGLKLTLEKADELTKSVARLKGVLVLQSGEAYIVDVPVRPTPAGR